MDVNMKKNLLSIIILALLIVNLVMTTVLMFSVVSTNAKTASLVGNVATVLQLDLTKDAQAAEAAGEVEVSIENTKVYDIADEMIIPLKKGEDGKDQYVVLKVGLSMDTKDGGFKKYGETIVEKESLIKSEIIEVVGNYTADEFHNNTDAVRQEILVKIQEVFDSKFIYKVSFSNILIQ